MFVKICGTTTEEDALLAVAMGADAVGFIFAPSPRQITAEAASDIIKRMPPEVLTIGVFRNETPRRVIDTVLETGVRGVQLHGFEGPQDIAEIRAKLPLFIIKAVRAGHPEVKKADKYLADAVLLDAPNPGSGQVYDWRLSDGVPDGVKLILAGGLNPENVTDAIEAVRPWGVDVVTGVESSPGRKDPRKLLDFIRRAKETEPQPVERVRTGEGPFDWQED